MPYPLYFALIIVIVYGFYQYQYSSTERRVTFTVNDKAIRVSGSKESTKSTYMVYTNVGVFTNEDDLFRGKYNSSDVYNTLTAGRRYQCKVVGWRVPFLSVYPNILTAYPVDSTASN